MPKKKNYMPKDISKFAHAISGLTEVIGESFTTSSNDGRMVSWCDGSDGYFLTLILDDNGKVHATVMDHVEAIKTYSAIGYLRYHRINFEAFWEPEGVYLDS